jgi:GTP-binding protein
MFCDKTTLSLFGGKGGNGCMSFRREKYIPKGGPNGGNGGNGGSIIIQATEDKNSLIDLHTIKTFSAPHGENGSGWDRNGKNGEDLILFVPVGTQVLYEGKCIADLKKHNDASCIVKGGKGGFGNAHFTSSIRQTPRFAELGEPGEEKEIDLELKLVADIGIIGLPSAGKSTLIACLTDARPKIADYPFTTLIPNLGVMKHYSKSLVFADIPGLIEGASEGKGLGDEFLRHISRNSFLLHLIDYNSQNVSKDYEIIRNELKKKSVELEEKEFVVVFSKFDTEDEELQKMIENEFRENTGYTGEIFFISALSKIGIASLKKYLFSQYETLKNTLPQKEEPTLETFQTYTLSEENERNFSITVQEKKTKKIFTIHGKRINQIAIMTDFSNEDAVERLWDIFKKMRIWYKLESLGATDGDHICFERFEGYTLYREMM